MELSIVFASLMLYQSVSATNLATAAERFILDAHTEAVSATSATLRSPEIKGMNYWVEDIQLRQSTEFTNSPFGRGASPTYQVRVTPKAWGQTQAEQAVLQLRSEEQEVQHKQALNSALYRRYQLLVDLMAQYAAVQQLINSFSLLNAEVQISRSLVGGRDFNTKLLETEVAVARTQGLIQVGLQRLNFLRAQIGLPPDTEGQVIAQNRPDWFIDYPQIQEAMRLELDPQQILGVSETRLQMERISLEDNVLKTKQRFGIAALSADYTFSANRSSNSAQIMLSLNIPLGADNFKSIDNRYALQEAQNAYAQRLAADTYALRIMRLNMLQLLQEWDLTKVSLQKNTARLASNGAKTDPELALTLRLEQSRQIKDQGDLEQKIMVTYVEYLYRSGLLAAQPLRNWIRRDSPAIAMN